VRWIRLIDKSDAPLHYSDQAAAAGHDGGRGALFALARLGAPARWPVMGAANIHKPCALAASSRPDHRGTLPPAAGGGRPIVGASSISKSPGRGYLGNYKNSRAAQIRTEHAMAKIKASLSWREIARLRSSCECAPIKPNRLHPVLQAIQASALRRSSFSANED
jgi:hypothetical protein